MAKPPKYAFDAYTLEPHAAMVSLADYHRIAAEPVAEKGQSSGAVAVEPTSDASAEPVVDAGTVSPMNTTRHQLSAGRFFQDWSSAGLITANDSWTGVPSIVGYLGDNITPGTAGDPRTVLVDNTTIDVIAQSTAGSSTGGVHEIEASQVVALQGSGTADAPNLIVYLDSTGRQNITFSAVLRELDGATVDQQIAIQYRVGNTGNFINLPGGAGSGSFTAAGNQTVNVNVVLPAAANNQPDLQIRIVTADAAGSDAMIGIDDITVDSQAAGVETQTVAFAGPVSQAEGNSGTTAYAFTVQRTGGTTGDLSFSGTIAPGATDGADFAGGAAPTTFSGTILAGQTSATVTIMVNGDAIVEGDEAFTLTLTTTGNAATGVTTAIGTTGGSTTGTIVNDDDLPASVAISDVIQSEGNSGTTNFTFTVTRSGGTGAFDVNFATADGTAAAGSDYSATSGTLNFLAGEMSKTVTVSVSGDTTFEASETFSVVLSGATNGAQSRPTT